jgi:hypothetical protein
MVVLARADRLGFGAKTLEAFDSKGLPNCLFGYALLAFAIA